MRTCLPARLEFTPSGSVTEKRATSRVILGVGFRNQAAAAASYDQLRAC